jgi:malate/lactate dehydrogenase
MKIAIVGTGRVGCRIAYALVSKQIGDHLIIAGLSHDSNVAKSPQKQKKPVARKATGKVHMPATATGLTSQAVVRG